MSRPALKRTYTRDDPRTPCPVHTGAADLDANRLAVFWRPLIDLAPSAPAPIRLRAVPLVSSWLADPSVRQRSWFSAIGVPGLRQQVVRHAGLPAYDCAEPAGLREELRSPGWHTLVAAAAAFATLDDDTRALLVFHLAQLSYCRLALKLSGEVAATGSAARDWYAYEVGRVQARYPGRTGAALASFERLATVAEDPLLVVLSCFQGIGHTLHSGGEPALAAPFERRGRSVVPSLPAEDWYASLVGSRFHRAVALLRLAEKDIAAARQECETAWERHAGLARGGLDDAQELVTAENHRHLLELRLRLALSTGHGDVHALTDELYGLDPWCVEARLTIGDAFAATGDYARAAWWFEQAGDLGTGAGALGWYRAGQAHDIIGERARALHAMARCLELDPAAAEPRAFIAARRAQMPV